MLRHSRGNFPYMSQPRDAISNFDLRQVNIPQYIFDAIDSKSCWTGRLESEYCSSTCTLNSSGKPIWMKWMHEMWEIVTWSEDDQHRKFKHRPEVHDITWKLYWMFSLKLAQDTDHNWRVFFGIVRQSSMSEKMTLKQWEQNMIFGKNSIVIGNGIIHRQSILVSTSKELTRKIFVICALVVTHLSYSGIAGHVWWELSQTCVSIHKDASSMTKRLICGASELNYEVGGCHSTMLARLFRSVEALWATREESQARRAERQKLGTTGMVGHKAPEARFCGEARYWYVKFGCAWAWWQWEDRCACRDWTDSRVQ